MWLHLSWSFLSSVCWLFNSAQVLSFYFSPCPLYQCRFSSISPCLSSCMQNTQRWSCCALSHAALSSIFLPDDWRSSSASFFFSLPRCTRHCLPFHPKRRNDKSKSRWHKWLQPSQWKEWASLSPNTLPIRVWSSRCDSARLQVVSPADVVGDLLSFRYSFITPVHFLQPGGK